MLPRNNRLKLERDFAALLKGGRSFFHPQFMVKSAKRQLAYPRIAITVSTKVSKRAVRRNRLRRVLREALRSNLAQIQPYDILISVKPTAIKIPEKHLAAELLVFLSKIKLLSHEVYKKN